MTSNQKSQNKTVADGYVVAPKNIQQSEKETFSFKDLLLEQDDSKVEFKFASITQKVIEKIAKSQKEIVCASSANLSTDTK